MSDYLNGPHQYLDGSHQYFNLKERLDMRLTWPMFLIVKDYRFFFFKKIKLEGPICPIQNLRFTNLGGLI